MKVYDFPEYYELAFSFRDIPAEVDFVEEIIRRYSKTAVTTILELGSGNAPHMLELCKRGYLYLGLELNQRMIAYARQKIATNGVRAAVFSRDMVDFEIPVTVDCVLVFLCSLYVKTDEELECHLKAVGRTIRRGGLYLLDGVVRHTDSDKGMDKWKESDGDSSVQVGYTTEWANEAEGLMKGNLSLEFEDNGQKCRVEHAEVRKTFRAAEFRQRIDRSQDWEYVAAFGDFDVDVEPENGVRSITVLRRL